MQVLYIRRWHLSREVSSIWKMNKLTKTQMDMGVQWRSGVRCRQSSVLLLLWKHLNDTTPGVQSNALFCYCSWTWRDVIVPFLSNVRFMYLGVCGFCWHELCLLISSWFSWSFLCHSPLFRYAALFFFPSAPTWWVWPHPCMKLSAFPLSSSGGHMLATYSHPCTLLVFLFDSRAEVPLQFFFPLFILITLIVRSDKIIY